MKYIPRILKDRIERNLKPGKAILLFGARRVGKTVLIKEIKKNFDGTTLFLNGENFDTLKLLENRSVSNYRMLLNGIDLLIIDEAQNIPEIGSVLKLIVDEMPELKVLASGSSSFDLKNKIGEPLVGRSKQYLLTPLSQQEISETETMFETIENLQSRLIYGSYPEVVTMDDNEEREDYLTEIVNAYLLKDILAVDGIKNSLKMRELLQMIALQIGSEVSYDELANRLGMSKNTVERYLDLLEKVFVVYRVGAFARNLRNEVTKAGKWYFYDTGIRNAIIRNFSPTALRQDNGALWENYLISERLKNSINHNKHSDFYFWRTYDKKEIDLIEETSGKLSAFELKWGDKKPNVPKNFETAYPDATFKVINRENYLTDFLKSSVD